METPQLRNGERCLHGQRQSMTWRTTSAILLLSLGIVMTAATGDGHQKIPRVVGGQPADVAEWPWQVSLKYTTYIACGGSLISPLWVVSAAHCVDSMNVSHFTVVLGALNLSGPSPTKVLVAVKRIIMHPIYEGDGTSGDLALLELVTPVSYNDHIRPVPLPCQDQEFPDGMMCWLTGWGHTAERVPLKAPHTLQEVELPLINYMDCNKMFQKALNLSLPIESVQKDMICAGYPEGKKDGCQGDSGGPLVCKSDGFWTLVGVVSWGDGCAQPNKPGVYTKISSFYSWIQEVTGVTAGSRITKYTMPANMTTLATEKTEVEPETVSSSEVPNGGAVTSGQKIHAPMSLLVGVIVVIRILNVV